MKCWLSRKVILFTTTCPMGEVPVVYGCYVVNQYRNYHTSKNVHPSIQEYLKNSYLTIRVEKIIISSVYVAGRCNPIGK